MRGQMTYKKVSRQAMKGHGDVCLSFADTPGIKRGLESPSAWKSPWFMNSLLPGQRIGTDVTYEDIGYYLNPGDKTYDAFGWMKKLSDNSAAAVAEAHKVLTNKNPEMVPEARHTGKGKSVKENGQRAKEPEISVPMEPNFVMAVDRLPLVHGVFELVGIGYTGHHNIVGKQCTLYGWARRLIAQLDTVR